MTTVPQPAPPRTPLRELLIKRWRFFWYQLPESTLPLLILLGLILIFLSPLVFSNLILARGDTFLYFYPYWEAAADALQNGRFPHWNPALFMGAPLLANSQVGFFYPLNWPLWLLLPIPHAVTASIVLHLFIAGWGAYVAAERTLALDRTASTITAVLFALGGYLTAQVEHINQLQGLAWLPWFLAALAYCADEKLAPGYEVMIKTAVAIGGLFGLQLLAGHTQTAFISGVAVLVWSAGTVAAYWLNRWREDGLIFLYAYRRFIRRLPISLPIGVMLALMLTAVQLLPTLELTQYSSRQGGLTLNEALSFSLHPLLLTRSLLPGYGQSLFTEYVAFLPLTAYLLAVVGAWQWRRWRGVLPAIMLVGVGLLLGLGQFNPLNWVLFRLPGFDLFRVPARWLILVALGVALLAGLGWQIVMDRYATRTLEWRAVSERARENLWHLERPLRVGLIGLAGLLLWSFISTLLAQLIPTGPEAPYEAPNRITAVLWAGELLLAFVWMSGYAFQRVDGRWRLENGRFRPPGVLIVVGLLLLFWGSRSLPVNTPTTPEAYFDYRPTVSRLVAAIPENGQPPDRLLSLSDIFFDPGDLPEIETIYADQLSAQALFDYTVAIKQKEILGPNLPMVWGLASVDGFDGGILPLRRYSELMSLLLPDGETTTDGRLREKLTAVPAAHWLDLFNTRYLITDKTGDRWIDISAEQNVFFDMQHPTQLASGATQPIGYVPPYAADGFVVAGSGAPGELVVTLADEETAVYPAEAVAEGLWRFDWPETAVSAALHGPENGRWQIEGVSLVNEAEGTFQPVVVGNYRLIHSGDVKIYENLDVLPRAIWLSDWAWVADEAAVLDKLRDPAWDGRETAVLVGAPISMPSPSAGTGQVVIQSYSPERIVMTTESETDGLLLLSDAYYAGWTATIDGQSAEIYVANGLFRGVLVASGSHEIVMQYRSPTFQFGVLVTAVGLVLVLAILVTFTALAISNRRFR